MYIYTYIYIYIYIYREREICHLHATCLQHLAISRVFKDVVFEDAVFDKNRCYLILYLDFT